MRNFFLTLILCPFLSMAQNDFLSTQGDIAKAEAKQANSMINFSANPDTDRYDLSYHRLELEVDPTQAFISGSVTSYYTAKEDLDEVVFDLAANMNVSSVEQHGNSLSYSRSGDELRIELSQMQTEGTLDSLTVNYSGDPVSSGFGSFEQTEHNGAGIIWTLSEPYGAKAWWPCKQDLNDKIDSLDIYLTAPRYNSAGEENMAVANGLQIAETISGNNKTTHYHHAYPIAAYLIGIAVTNYSVYTQQVSNNGNPFQVINYVYPENLSAVQEQTPVIIDIIDLFTEYFGEYPYADEKYGQAQFGWNGGMEHQTVSFIRNFDRQLAAHELGHQWFGDKVTCASWQDIWLNEGFAGYMAAMVIQDLDGEAEFTNWRQSSVGQITSLPGGSVYVPASDTTSVSRIFDSRLSYSKGAMILHMLRKKLGEQDFFQALRNYLHDPDLAYAYAHTPDLKDALTEESGLDLTEFFQDWVYSEGYPTYNLEWNRLANHEVEIELSQEQSHPSVDFFEGGVPVRLIGDNGEVMDTTLEHSENNQLFSILPGFEVTSIEVDPDYNMISAYNSVTLETELPKKIIFNIYPNPAQNIVFIEKSDTLKIKKISIYNTLGQEVKRVGEPKKSFSVSDLSSGVYFLEVKSSVGMLNKTLIVE